MDRVTHLVEQDIDIVPRQQFGRLLPLDAEIRREDHNR
jgi:hypothetical protein